MPGKGKSKTSKGPVKRRVRKELRKASTQAAEKNAKNKIDTKEEGEDPKNPVRIYCDGVFDMFHIGHAKVLEQAKKMFKHVHLIVGVSGDEETWRLKGKTVMNEVERADSVWHCKWADEVVCPCPWVITPDFLEEKNIDYVAHDDLPYGSAGSGDIYAEIKKLGKFKATQRTEGISTSDLILRIIKDYDKYLYRSLNRGYTAKELGISKTKEFRVKLNQKYIPELKADYEGMKGKVKGAFKKWKSNSTHLIDNFIRQFHPDHKPKRKNSSNLEAIESHDNDEISDFDY